VVLSTGISKLGSILELRNAGCVSVFVGNIVGGELMAANVLEGAAVGVLVGLFMETPTGVRMGASVIGAGRQKPPMDTISSNVKSQ
jgi:hypothetical protein